MVLATSWPLLVGVFVGWLSSHHQSRPLVPASVTAVKAFVDLSHGEHHAEEAPDYPYLHSTC